MNANDLLDAIGSAKDTYVTRAAACRQPQNHRRKPKRLWLMAAIITLMVFLMGSAMMLFSLRDKVIDTPQPSGTAEETKSVVALYGYEGQPLFAAAKEWYAYTKNHAPEGGADSAGDAQLTFLGHYREVYGCYTREMADKAEAVAAENGLKLLSGIALVQREEVPLFLDALGLTDLHHADKEAFVNYGGGYFHPEGNFNLTVDVTLTGADAVWPYGTMGTFHYARKDCFDPDYALAEPESYDQWNYTTADGTELLMVMGAECAMLFAEKEDAWITVTLMSSPYSDTNPVPDREALQQLAEIYNFSVEPKVPDWDATTATLKAAEDARIARADARQAVEYAGFAEFLKARYTRVRGDICYGFADVTGDGEAELLLGDGSGSFETVLRLTEAGVEESIRGGCFFLCANGYLESVYLAGYEKSHSWYAMSESFFFDYSDNTQPEAVVHYDSRTDIWTDNHPWVQEEARNQITEAEAAAVPVSHPRQQIPMRSLMEFPLEDGSTLEDYILAREFTVSEAECMAIYGDHLESVAPELRTERSHFCLYDLNGDGIKDLLIGTENHFRDALTVHNGQLKAIEQWCTMNLCADGILRICSGNSYRFCRFEGTDMVVVDILDYDPQLDRYNRCTDGDGYYDRELTKEEFEEILAGYGVVDLPMIPVADFPGA